MSAVEQCDSAIFSLKSKLLKLIDFGNSDHDGKTILQTNHSFLMKFKYTPAYFVIIEILY